MNVAIIMGKLTADPEVRYTQGGDAVANYTLAVDRDVKKEEGKQTADFIRCKAFGRGAEFAEKWLTKGTQIAVMGSIRTGSYTDREGRKVYTTDVQVSRHWFTGSKSGESKQGGDGLKPTGDFIDLPANLDAELPFGL